MGFYLPALEIPMVWPYYLTDDLFLFTQRGIYSIMQRNKKNTQSEPQDLLIEKAPDPVDCVADNPIRLKPAEINGPKGPEPTRYGDWEQKGRCTDF